MSTGSLIQIHASARVRYEIHGSGPNLVVGHPITMRRRGPDALRANAVSEGYIERLAERYRLIVMDDLATDANAPQGHDSFTIDKVTSDILAVADAAEAEQFAWYGYSWGAVVGLQLAIRTTRLTALVCGGWPPLGGPYTAAAAASEWSAANGGSPLHAAYYRSLLKDWNERDAVSRLTCPRMVFAGAKDTFTAVGHEVRIGPTVGERRRDLEQLGWAVRIVDGFRHDLGEHPDVTVPIIRGFLDPILPRR